MKSIRSSLTFGLALLLAGCAPASVVQPPLAPEPVTAEPGYAALEAGTLPGERRTDHLIVFSIDGLRPDAIERFGATTLQRLAEQGSHTLAARTISPSRTLPSHTSMVTGVEPSVHGITWNDNRVDEQGRLQLPSMFSLARAHGYHAAAFFSKGKFAHLLPEGSIDHAVLPSGDGKWLSGRTVEAARDYLDDERPNLLFVHFAEPDYAGHLIGWMSMPYGWAVRRADRAVAEVLDAADSAFGKGNYTVIVTADHGGHSRTHGSDAESDMLIPWIAWGRGVAGATRIAGEIRTTDTAATALWLLGVDRPDFYTGRPVAAAFHEASLPAEGGAHTADTR